MSRAIGGWLDLAMFRITLFGMTIVLVISSATSSSTAGPNTTFLSSALSPTPVPTPPLSHTPTPSSMLPSPTSSHTPHPTPTTYKVLDNDKTCILMRAIITINISYTEVDGNTSETIFRFNNDTAMVDPSQSNCSSDDSRMTIMWSNGTMDVPQYVTFYFESGQYQWKMNRVEQVVNVTESDFNNTNNTGVLNLQLNKTVFLNEYQRSYKCESVSLKLSGKFNSTNATINSTVVLDELQVQAFDFRRNNTFGNARECPADQKKNIKLPIAVGSLLALFLTAVIVVYILSRFRKRQLTSYESLN